MGRIAEALRGNLRQLAQADARLLRQIDQALPADGLDALNIKQLKQCCREQGLKGYSSLGKQMLIARLRAAIWDDPEFLGSPTDVLQMQIDQLSDQLQDVLHGVENAPTIDRR